MSNYTHLPLLIKTKMYAHYDRDAIALYSSSSFSILTLRFSGVIRIQEGLAPGVIVQYILFMTDIFCI